MGAGASTLVHPVPGSARSHGAEADGGHVPDGKGDLHHGQQRNDEVYARCEEWTPAEVAQHVASIGKAFEGYAQAIMENGIDGKTALCMNERDVDDLGLGLKQVHKKRLLLELQAMKQQQQHRKSSSSSSPVVIHPLSSPPPIATKTTNLISSSAAATPGPDTLKAPPSKPAPGTDKFHTDVGLFVFGGADDFRDGLTKKIKKLKRSMRQECLTNDGGKWVGEFSYAVEQAAEVKRIKATRVRDEGHGGMTLDDFYHHPISMEAKLTKAEVAALRMYTGPLFEPWNYALRVHNENPKPLEDWGTCISVLYNAIFKLSFLTKKATVYRGTGAAPFY